MVEHFDWTLEARNSLQVQSDRIKEYYDQNLVGRDIQVGDAVWMHDSQAQ